MDLLIVARKVGNIGEHIKMRKNKAGPEDSPKNRTGHFLEQSLVCARSVPISRDEEHAHDRDTFAATRLWPGAARLRNQPCTDLDCWRGHNANGDDIPWGCPQICPNHLKQVPAARAITPTKPL
eukprot:2548405-Pleurochrysis_carterae.AAC.1